MAWQYSMKALFGLNDSRLFLAEEQGNNFNITSFNIGDGGNHLSINRDSLIVTVNGSGKILIFNLLNKTIDNSIDTQTGLYDGPEERHWLSMMSFIIQHIPDISKTTRFNGMQSDSVKLDGKGKGLAIISYNEIAVANIFLPDYSPDSIVTIFTYLDGVAFKNYSDESQLYPNPTSGIFNFETDLTNINSQNAIIEISSLEGRLLGVFNNPVISGNKIKFVISTEELEIPSGVYFARLNAGNYSTTKLFCVIR